jgi:hypothetical protein
MLLPRRLPGSNNKKMNCSRTTSYYHLVAAGQIVLAAIYAKAEQENLPPHTIRKLVE